MKKFLLPLCLLGGAFIANAEGDVYFEDDFSWLAPWVTEHNLGDPVGTNDPEATGVSITQSSMIGTWGGNIFHEMMNASIVTQEEQQYSRDDPGYLTRIWDGQHNSNYWVFYAYNGYLRIGSNGVNCGLRTPSVTVPKDVTELYIEFDWCPCKDKDGLWHDVALEVEYRPGNVLIADDIYNPFEEDSNHPLQWIHECIDVFDTPGTTTGEGVNAIIEVSKSNGLQIPGASNFYLDNIRIASTKLDNSAVNDIAVDNSANQPVEYYNLQGIRVDNPENGIFIRRQGKKVTKIAF